MHTDGKDKKGLIESARGAIGDAMSTPPPYSKGLLNFFDRPEVKGLYYNGQRLVLDGYSFIGCRFDNCTLLVY